MLNKDEFEKYSGELINELPNGYGSIVLDSGIRVVGHFSDGELDGSGTLYCPNGNIIEGEFVRNDIIRGKVKYKSGNVFVGTFKDDAPYEGIMEYTNGDKFEGIIYDKNMKKGTYHYKDGSKYIGTIRDNKKHGDGIYYESNNVSEGRYEYDKRVGKFYITTPTSKIQATYSDDVLHGYFRCEENNIISEGNYVNGKMDGRWKIIKNGKTDYHTYSNGKLIETTEKTATNIINFSDYKNNTKTDNYNNLNKFTSYTVKFENKDKSNNLVDKKIIEQLENSIKENYAQKNKLLKIEKDVNKNFEDSPIYNTWQTDVIEYGKLLVKLSNKRVKLLPNGDAIYSNKLFGLVGTTKLNGIGCHQTKNGNYYIGNFKNGKLDGIGYHFMSTKAITKDVYFGEYKDGNEYGNGVRFLSNCNILGKYIDRKYVGIGKIEFENGNIYIGELRVKGRHGKGVTYYDNEEKIIGNYSNDHYYGYSIYFLKNGNYQIGYYNNESKMDGLIAVYNSKNQLLGAYTYDNGVLSGPAKIIYTNGEYEYKMYYLGEEANSYENNDFTFHGKLDKNGYAISGKVDLPDGRIYIGSFENGKLTGKNSKMYFPNGDVFTGEVKDGEIVNGTMTYKKYYRDLFTKYTGPFKNGIPVTFGRFYYTQPNMWCEGFIINGMPNGAGTLHCNGKDTKYNFKDGLI